MKCQAPSLVILWHQRLFLNPTRESLRLTYQKTSGDPVQLVDELHYGNALGGADSLSARLGSKSPPPS